MTTRCFKFWIGPASSMTIGKARRSSAPLLAKPRRNSNPNLNRWRMLVSAEACGPPSRPASCYGRWQFAACCLSFPCIYVGVPGNFRGVVISRCDLHKAQCCFGGDKPAMNKVRFVFAKRSGSMAVIRPTPKWARLVVTSWPLCPQPTTAKCSDVKCRQGCSPSAPIVRYKMVLSRELLRAPHTSQHARGCTNT
jgi:hypothetical protein